MAKNRGNMFEAAAGAREKEQRQLAASVTGQGSDTGKRATMMISLSEKQRLQLKMYAMQHGKTASAVVQGWIDEFCGE